MNRLQKQLVWACRELGIRIVAPFEVRIGARAIIVDAFLPQLGAPFGMLVVQDWVEIASVVDDLVAVGYGYSTMTEPGTFDEYSTEMFIELFRDWGWSSSTEESPDWMT